MKYIIENSFLRAEVSDLGATLCSLIDKKSGLDVVLGFDSEEEYLQNDCYIGASVGRNANRIGNACFDLNGVSYKLSVNDNMNQLHGGVDNFSRKYWPLGKKGDDEVSFVLFSKDGEEGFPGNLNVEVAYRLVENSLVWSYRGESDQDTVLNMTNHSYFSLTGDNIFKQELCVYTDKYSPVDEFFLTKDEVSDVKDTPYDFTDFRLIGDNLASLPCGIDNNYVFEKLGDKKMVELRSDQLSLCVYSDLPDMHLYTSYNLHSDSGKYGRKYQKFDAVCFEGQFYPNSINYDRFIKPILKKGEVMEHYIRYEINNR